MGDRHGGCFARRDRALSPRRPRADAHRGVDFRWRAVVGGICPAGNALLGEGLPTRRTGERVCPAQKHAPRRRPPDTAHERRDLPHARRLSSAKASRHGARAKRFAPREKALLGEGLPTRREGERICPAQEHAPRRKPPDTAQRRKDLPRGVRPRPTYRRTAGRPRPTDSRKNTLRRGRTHSACGRCRVHSPKKIRLLHETQFFHGESHVGSRPIFPSFPSVGRCAARERNPAPPVAPHRGRGHRGLRRDGEMCHGFGEMVRRFGE